MTLPFAPFGTPLEKMCYAMSHVAEVIAMKRNEGVPLDDVLASLHETTKGHPKMRKFATKMARHIYADTSGREHALGAIDWYANCAVYYKEHFGLN